MHKFRYFWNRTGAILLFGVCVATLYFYQLGILLLPLYLKHHDGIHGKAALHAAMHAYDPLLAGITIILAVVQITLLYSLYRHQLRKRNPLRIGRKPFHLEELFFLVAMYGLVLLANYAVARFGTPQNQSDVLAEMKILPWTLFFMAGVLAPFIEELIFRGVFMNLFWQKDNRLNNVAAVVCSGLLFGAMHEPHLSVFLLLYSSLGMVLAYTYRRQRDLRYNIGLHMFINFLPAVAGLLRAFLG
ncbi:CPBP family intramembrane glutamic endopeptidase [Lacticaseibacillus zhaodongensis]|uniref:CPBP family intramembrane glutamic endopeptidase n=1 Tax=Lacticaseibacillus zhaodongensis TaxID=2668065 RepID=UPI0012D360FF|nr:CPBP family intramembrane glutamic endopeptidase [Lacticaseibacillus zhaodongensis]